MAEGMGQSSNSGDNCPNRHSYKLVETGIGAMELTMRIPGLLSVLLCLILSTTGCQPQVAGNGVYAGSGTENSPSLQEETQRLKAARAESRAKLNQSKTDV